MSQEFQQHWLSAYLDNELSNDERALVERRLQEDAETRQLLEDLKRVRSLVATLPGWPGANFQFDMSRLADDELDELDEEDGQESHRGIATSSPASIQSSSPPTTKILEDKKPTFSLAAWRGVLALAAGLLLLVLCVPLYLQRNNADMAVSMRAPESELPPGAGGGGRGGGGADNANNTGDAFQLDGSVDAPAPATTGDLAMAPKVLSTEPANEPASAPADPRQFRGSRGGNNPPGPAGAPAPSPAAPAAPAAPENLRSAAGGLGGVTMSEAMQPKSSASRSMELPKEQASDAKPGNLFFDAASLTSDNPFLCAKSNAWSEVEVQQALPQVLNQISENSQLAGATSKQKSNLGEMRTETTARSVEQQEDKAAKGLPANEQNELLISDLPNNSDLNNWFVQIQSAQPLTQLQVASSLQLKKVQEPDKLSEAIALPGNGRSIQPPAPAAASAKEVPAAAASKPDSAKSATVEPSTELGATTAQTGKRAQGQIVLFVTEAEAAKIRALVKELAAVNFMRVPSQPSEPKQNADEKKVIVILNQR